MTLAAAVLAGFLAGRLLWLSLAATFDAPVFERANYRGHPLPTAAGVVIPAALVVVEAGRVIAGAAGAGDAGITGPRAVTIAAALGFGLLGLVDDLAGVGDARGFRGHVASLLRGRLTTGGLKLVGGACVAVLVCSVAAGPEVGVGALLRDAALVALAANLGNLFDRAPGRTLKVSLVAFVALALLCTRRTPLVDAAVCVGAGLALLRDDLHERLMLGDAGANVLGGVIGLGVVLTTAPSTRTAVLVGVAALNVVSELVSFSRVIDGVAPLRALDRAGRPRRH